MTDTRLPYQKHLEWLCLEGLTAQDIRSYYDSIQMAQPSDGQVERAVQTTLRFIMPPITKRRLHKKLFHIDDQAVWKKHGFEDIYLHQLGKRSWSELGRVLNHPVMRVALECCLIAKLSYDEISQLLPSVYALPLSVESIETYIKYFFDYINMRKPDWQAFLNQIADDRYTHTRLFFALTRPQEEVLHAVGLPSRLQFGTMLKNVMNTANYRFEYYARQQNPESQEEARKWARLMMDAGVRHEKFGATDATDFSKLIQTQFEYLENEIPNVTPEMLADAKPPIVEQPKGLAQTAPMPPDASGQAGGNDSI